MRAQLLTRTMMDLYKVRRTLCIEGAPGGGKTSLADKVAHNLAETFEPVQDVIDRAIVSGNNRFIGRCKVFNGSFGYIELHMPTMLTEDFGVPDMMTSNQFFAYKLPEWFPAIERTDLPDNGIICFDDRNQAGNDLQKVQANICQARNLHGARLKDGWQVISTGNRISDRAGANRVLSHLRNRETVVELETHLDDWCNWAMASGVHPTVISFIRFKPDQLHEFDPQRESNPTPRSWAEGVSDIIDVAPKEAEYECFKGAVGEGAASAFSGFLKIYRNLPDPDAIIMNPDGASVPTDPATLYALSGALSHRAEDGNLSRIAKYLARIPGEFSALTMTMAIRRDDSLTKTAAFADWTISNQEVLF